MNRLDLLKGSADLVGGNLLPNVAAAVQGAPRPDLTWVSTSRFSPRQILDVTFPADIFNTIAIPAATMLAPAPA